MKPYENWWNENVANGKHYTLDRFRKILGNVDSRKVYPKLIPENNRCVIDVGCGLGLDYEHYLENGTDVEYFGIDSCRGFIEDNKTRYPEANFLRGKSYELPFKDKEFGLATSRHVLEHLKEPYSTIGEMCRVSDRVAIIWFILPGEAEKIRLTGKGFYKNKYSKTALLNCIAEFGFETTIKEIWYSKSKKHQLWYLTQST